MNLVDSDWLPDSPQRPLGRRRGFDPIVRRKTAIRLPIHHKLSWCE